MGICFYIEERTLASLAAEYSVSKAAFLIGNVHTAKNAKQIDEAMNQYELTQEIRRLRQKKAELEKENQNEFGLRWLFSHMKICPNAYYNGLNYSRAAYLEKKQSIYNEIKNIYQT